MNITFTAMTQADVAAAAALWHEGWHAGHAAVVPHELMRLRTLESFQDRLGKHIGATRVATQNGTVIGFIILHGDEVYQFYLGQAARGTGAADALMADAEDQLRAAGFKRAWLACTTGNDRAARFYEKSGWSRTRTETLSFETSDGPFPLEIWRYEKAL